MKILNIVIGLFLLAPLGAQQKASVLTKVTATWCPNCGTWGWDYFEALKDVYQNDPQTTLLGVHHSGDLRTDVASWFADNYDFIYQPQFYHNNTDLDVTRNNWNSKVDSAIDNVDETLAEEAVADIRFINAFIEDGMAVCNVELESNNSAQGEYYIAVYIFENNVSNFQSSRGMSNHPNVLRDYIGDEYYGTRVSSLGKSNGGKEVFNFEKTLNSSWDSEDLGLLTVIWKEENGKYIFENSRSIYNIGLLSSSEELLDENDFKISYTSRGIELQTQGSSNSRYVIVSSDGQVLTENVFSGRTEINTRNYSSGLYVIWLEQEGKRISRQFVVAN